MAALQRFAAMNVGHAGSVSGRTGEDQDKIGRAPLTILNALFASA